MTETTKLDLELDRLFDDLEAFISCNRTLHFRYRRKAYEGGLEMKEEHWNNLKEVWRDGDVLELHYLTRWIKEDNPEYTFKGDVPFHNYRINRKGTIIEFGDFNSAKVKTTKEGSIPWYHTDAQAVLAFHSFEKESIQDRFEREFFGKKIKWDDDPDEWVIPMEWEDKNEGWFKCQCMDGKMRTASCPITEEYEDKELKGWVLWEEPVGDPLNNMRSTAQIEQEALKHEVRRDEDGNPTAFINRETMDKIDQKITEALFPTENSSRGLEQEALKQTEEMKNRLQEKFDKEFNTCGNCGREFKDQDELSFHHMKDCGIDKIIIKKKLTPDTPWVNDWAKWRVVDSFGDLEEFKHKPHILQNRSWDNLQEYGELIDEGGYDSTNWQESLEERCTFPDHKKVDKPPLGNIDPVKERTRFLLKDLKSRCVRGMSSNQAEECCFMIDEIMGLLG